MLPLSNRLRAASGYENHEQYMNAFNTKSVHIPTNNITVKVNLFVMLSLLNRWTKFDEFWYSDGLAFGDGYRLRLPPDSL